MTNGPKPSWRRPVPSSSPSSTLTSCKTPIDTNNLVVLGAVDQATMIYAVPLFGNPERKLQQRQGSDYSTSWADSVMAATGLEEALKLLDDADLRKKGGDAFSVDTVPLTGSRSITRRARCCSVRTTATVARTSPATRSSPHRERLHAPEHRPGHPRRLSGRCTSPAAPGPTSKRSPNVPCCSGRR
jgi:hypothetical protein